MEVLDGHARKISLIILVLSAVAWVVFIIAFGWLQSNAFNADSEDEEQTSDLTWSRSNFHHTLSQFGGDGDENDNGYALDTETRQRLPFYMFTGGPILYLIMFINLLVGHPCSGCFAYFFTGAYIAAGGACLYLDGTIIYIVNDYLLHVHPGTDYDIFDFEVGRYIVMEFCGCFASVLLMAIHMAMWACFTNPWMEPRRRGYTLHYDDDVPPVMNTNVSTGPTVVQPVNISMESATSYPPPPIPMAHPVPPPPYNTATAGMQ